MTRVCAVILLAWAITVPAAEAQVAPGGIVLDERQLVALVRGRAPAVLASRSRSEEARAARVGAGAPATNPELAASAGPRLISGVPTLDVAVTLSVPFDVSGAAQSRSALADERTRVADAEVLKAEWLAIAEALELWVQVGVAADRVQLEKQRVRLDEERLRIARVRRAAGAVGEGDVALALVLEAEGKARQQVAVAEHEALTTELRHALGVSPHEAITGVMSQPGDTVPDLEALLVKLNQHPALLWIKAVVDASARDTNLQRNLAMPPPRVALIGERSPEYVARLGFDVTLPVFQRNQTQTAIAESKERTGTLDLELARRRLETDLRAAHARLLGARGAYVSLRNVQPSVDDAELLASRAYELGQVTLTAVVGVHREVFAARASLLEAKAAALRAQIITQLASGSIL